MLRLLDTLAHRLTWVVPHALYRSICDRYEARLLGPVASEKSVAEYYQAHRNDPGDWSEPVRREVAYRHRDDIVEGSGVPVEPRRLGVMYSVRFTAEDAAALREAAIRRGETVSDLLRQAAQRYIQPSGFACAHTTISMGGAGHLVSVSAPCGCQMEPVYAA